MSKTVNVDEAKTQLSRLLDRVSQGEEVIIAKAGRPVALLVSVEGRPKRRLPVSAVGRAVLSEDFDVPLPEDVLESCER